MIHDNLLIGVAKLLNSESYTVPSHATFSTSDLTLSTDMSSFTGEIPTRIALTETRAVTVDTFVGIRSGAVVGSSAGETLYEAALFDAASSGNLGAMASLPGILQTTNFDVEVNWDVSVERDE